MSTTRRPGRWLAPSCLVLLVGAVAGGTPAPLDAVEATDPEFAAFAAELGDLVPDSQRAALAAATEADGAGDLFHPSGEAPGIAAADVDLGLVASFDIEMPADVAATAAGPGGILSCETDGTVCSALRAGQPAGTSFGAYAGSMRAPLTPAAEKRLEFGVAVFDETPRDGRPAAGWEAIPEFPGDFFQRSNLAWTLLSEDGEPLRLMRLEYGPGDAGFLAAKTDAVAILRGSAWMILVPKSEWDGTVSSRHYSFRADGGSFEPATSAVDTYPDIFDPATPSAEAPTIAIESTVVRSAFSGWLVPGALAAVGLALLVAGWIVGRRRRGR